MSEQTPGQAAVDDDDPEIPVRLVRLYLCDLCLDGVGGECHVPGCALWINRAPDLPIRDSAFVTILDDEQLPLSALLDDRNQLREALRRIALGQDKDPSVAADKALTASRELREQWESIEPQAAPGDDELARVLASVAAERSQLRIALQRLADDGNLEARDRLANIREVRTAEPQAAPEPTPGELELSELTAFRHLAQPEQAAPELAAAMAETRKVRKVVRELISMFHGISGGYGARTSVGRLNRLAREAGVEPLQPGDPLSAVVADELGVLQDRIGNLAAGLKLSAGSSHPSKKSEIEASVADALLALLDPR